MNLQIKIFATIIIVHFFADFVFQAEEWALGKSKKWKPLLKHTSVYSIFWLLPFWALTINLIGSICFVIATFIAHTITDYFTSRIVSKRFESKHYGSPIPNFGAFTIIGIDQALHYLQLIICYELFATL